jgi:hypothetical protein
VTAGPQRGRRQNLEVPEEEFTRVKRLVLGKARRYSLEPVPVSDRLVVSFSPEQLERLARELAEEDPSVTVEWRDQTGYSAEIAARNLERPSRFGGDPRRSEGARHPKSVDWANVEGKRGSRS